MVFCILVFNTRLPTVTPAEFEKHWDTTHMDVIKSIAGKHFPITHTRHYISRTVSENGTWPANVLIGTPEDFTFDAVAELVFEDEPAFRRFLKIISEPEAAARIAEDEKNFMVRDLMKIVVKGKASITARD